MIPRSSHTPSPSASEGATERTNMLSEDGEPRATYLQDSSANTRLPTSASSQSHRQHHASITSNRSETESTSFAHSLQDQLEFQQQQQQKQQQPGISRSSPIAITRQPDAAIKPLDYMNSDSDDDDDGDSTMDEVERDAIKLNKKFGGPIVQTYQAPSTLSITNTRRGTGSSSLNAPYLGSLSRSANQVMNLPPMSLTGTTSFGDAREEPPEAISTVYGSLRDSHQRGRFLDGPSSYREPTSGRIRLLDHRLRYHGTGSNELSIGERMQQSRKLKESRQKEKRGDDERQSSVAKSSLSAMMNEASKHPAEEETTTMSSLGEEILMPVKPNDDLVPSLRDYDQEFEQDTKSAPSMLSTSMTAFELLKMSNVSSNLNSMSLKPSSLSLRPHAAFVNAEGLPTTIGSPAVIPIDPDDPNRRFQPLARSMSDPTPQLQQMSLRDARAGVVYPNRRFSPGSPPQEQPHLQQPFVAVPYGYGSGASILPTGSDHDPDMDGAFGDLEME
ncbi:hypothetical protein IV203_038124 [Nitzschia inconspicua]|uniref:Uncharacterized protein n=1 Tax=Nitzschia inconspicua TaxID=303405 RepID=A0A9K3LQV2_9STRA|nr:hypothetical protein IV203_038124 [Nitzschia inconspicua]